jgi:hypothetical protein
MERVDMLFEPVRAVLLQIGAFLPRLGVALLVLLAGWLLAKAVRFAVVKGLRAINFNVLTERAGMDGFLEQGGIRSDTTAILGLIVYWLVILAALIVGSNSLGLAQVTDLLRDVVLFLPKVVVALLILAFGAYFARFIANAVITYCKNIGLQDAELLARLAQYAIIAFVVLIALDHLEVGGRLIHQSFLIVLGGVVLALALAFGLGGREWAADLLERWWPKRGREKDER